MYSSVLFTLFALAGAYSPEFTPLEAGDGCSCVQSYHGHCNTCGGTCSDGNPCHVADPDSTRSEAPLDRCALLPRARCCRCILLHARGWLAARSPHRTRVLTRVLTRVYA